MATPEQSTAALEAKTLREQGSVQEALERFGDIEQDPASWGDVSLVLEVARSHSLAGNEADVEKFFLRCAELNRHRAALYRCQIGWFFQRRKRWARALGWYDQALETFPTYHLCLFRKGYCLERLHRPHDAAEALLRAADVFDASTPEQRARSLGIQIQVLFHLARNLRETRSFAAAREALQKCANLDSGPDVVIKPEHLLASRAEISISADDGEAALQDLEKARLLDDRSSVLWERFGRAYQLLGRNKEAEEALEAAVRLPKGAVSLLALARFLAAQDRWADCAEILNRALEVHPQGETQIRLEIAKLHMALGRPQAALVVLERLAAGRVPQGSTIAMAVDENISQIHRLAGYNSLALRYLRSASTNPNAPATLRERLDDLLAVHTRDGDRPVALEDAPLPHDVAAVLGADPDRIDGTVVSYFPDRGYGFIEQESEKQTIFFHISHCRGFDDRTPAQGDMVSFAVGTNPRSGKTQAEEVERRALARAAQSVA